MNKEDNDLIDLLLNEDFKRWVMMPTAERDLYWNTWLSDNPARQQLVIQAKEFIRSVNYSKLEFENNDKEIVLAKIISEKNSVSYLKGAKGSARRYIYFKVAAVFLIMLTVAVLVNEFLKDTDADKYVSNNIRKIKKSTDEGQRLTFALPDGSVAHLNNASQLTYPSRFNEKQRVIHLQGEAFFEVKSNSGRPFIVESRGVYTTAVGTEFNVNAYDDAILVSVKEGKVVLTSDSVNTLPVRVNEAAVHNANGNLHHVPFDDDKSYGWVNGVMVMKDQSLQEVKRMLEKWYGVEIRMIGHHDDWKLNGRFEKKSLDEVLKSLSFTYDFKYKIVNNIVTINL